MENWINITSALVGAITGGLVGGVITWKVTEKSLKKQFNFESKIKKEQFDFEMKVRRINDLKEILKALIAIKTETKLIIVKLENVNKEDNEDVRKKIRIFDFNNNNWMKLNQELLEFELKGDIDEIAKFHSMLNELIKNDFEVDKETLEILIEQGKDGFEFLIKNIKFIKEKIKKLEEELS